MTTDIAELDPAALLKLKEAVDAQVFKYHNSLDKKMREECARNRAEERRKKLQKFRKYVTTATFKKWQELTRQTQKEFADANTQLKREFLVPVTIEADVCLLNNTDFIEFVDHNDDVDWEDFVDIESNKVTFGDVKGMSKKQMEVMNDSLEAVRREWCYEGVILFNPDFVALRKLHKQTLKVMTEHEKMLNTFDESYDSDIVPPVETLLDDAKLAAYLNDETKDNSNA